MRNDSTELNEGIKAFGRVQSSFTPDQKHKYFEIAEQNLREVLLQMIHRIVRENNYASFSVSSNKKFSFEQTDLAYEYLKTLSFCGTVSDKTRKVLEQWHSLFKISRN